MYRAALIGCGRIGGEPDDSPGKVGIYTHAGAYSACSETRLVALCDIDPDRLARCGERWHVTACYRDPHELLAAERPDIVSLCTPDDTHAGLLRTVLQAPGIRAVLTEKPLAQTPVEALELTRLAEDRGIVLAVNYIRRFAPSHVALKGWLDSGELGSLQTISGYYGKGLIHNGTHWFDLVRCLAGEVDWVRGCDRLHEAAGDPTLDVELTFVNGARGFLFGLDSHCFAHFEMDLIGANGRIRLTEFGHDIESYMTVDNLNYRGYRELARVESRFPGGLKDVLLHAVADVVRCVEKGGQPRCTGRDAVAALKIAFAARTSLTEGRPQQVIL